MATATPSPASDLLVTVSGQRGSAPLSAPPEASPSSGKVDQHGQYRCQCGYTLRVFGRGRHRVYFEPSNVRSDDPVMNGICPRCAHGLPGKNPS